MLFQCWPTICDAGPTLKQHWVNDACLLGISYHLLFLNLLVFSVFISKISSKNDTLSFPTALYPKDIYCSTMYMYVHDVTALIALVIFRNQPKFR